MNTRGHIEKKKVGRYMCIVEYFAESECPRLYFFFYCIYEYNIMRRSLSLIVIHRKSYLILYIIILFYTHDGAWAANAKIKSHERYMCRYIIL